MTFSHNKHGIDATVKIDLTMDQRILVTSPRITSDSTALMEAAEASGQLAMRLPSFRPTPALENAHVAVYGESLFAIIITSALNHVVLEPTSDWLPSLAEKYRGRSVIKQTIGAARMAAQPQFVKIADGTKGFDARVYASGDDLPPAEYYPDDSEVLVSEPVFWEVEYRCFVLEGVPLTMSVYLREGELAQSPDGEWLHDDAESEEAADYCARLLDDPSVLLPPACVIDIGRIEGHGWAVVEANPAYGSGIYGCDPLKVLRVINRATIRVQDITSRDEPWVGRYEVED